MHVWREHTVHVGRSNTNSRIADPETDCGGVATARDSDRSARGRKLDGVRDQIEQDLLKSLGVGRHENIACRRRDHEREAIGFCLERA